MVVPGAPAWSRPRTVGLGAGSKKIKVKKLARTKEHHPDAGLVTPASLIGMVDHFPANLDLQVTAELVISKAAIFGSETDSATRVVTDGHPPLAWVGTRRGAPRARVDGAWPKRSLDASRGTRFVKPGVIVLIVLAVAAVLIALVAMVLSGATMPPNTMHEPIHSLRT
jgi:hypothetical protein